MRKAIELSTVRISDRESSARSRVFFSGNATDTLVDGAVLETAIYWANNFLLFMTDDVPAEDILSIHLLDDRLTIVDSAWVGGPYSTGSFELLNLREPNLVEFRFSGDTTWTIELLSKPVFRLPFFSDPPGVMRPVRLSRRFLVHGNPRPQS